MNSEKSLIDRIIDDIVDEFGSELSDEHLRLMIAFGFSIGIYFKIVNIIRDVKKEIKNL